ncbi:cytochrome c class I [Lewinellaceae bacterium SD302]|nr:cytochrome c class I [Lewinellaceae bacterium SD302]
MLLVTTAGYGQENEKPEPAADVAAAATDGASAPGTGDANIGKALWNENACGTCHIKNMKDNGTGPALGGVETRWASEPRENLYEWIRGSQALIAAGNSARAAALWKEWGPTVMQNYPALTNQEIEHLLAYIDYQYLDLGKVVVSGEGGGDNVREETDNTWLFIILGGALLLLSLILARVTSNLSYMVQTSEGTAPATRRTLAQILTSKGMIAFVIFALVVFGGYNAVNSAVDLGRQQEYQPEQPIKFSHQLHAGMQKIECEYCHDGARRSKHSVIPAANTCMNCHAAIKYGSNYGTAELTKIYASIGWDPTTGKYIEGYEDYSREQIYDLFGNWISSQYMANDGDVDMIDDVVEEQLDGITAALTNGEDDTRIPGPIEWVRIHNMPDHVYFNHAQHVTVGQLACQNCHGPVEEMEVVYQYSPLSMGWCINCHRQTEVAFEGNEYYQSYERYHEEMQSGDRDAVTVEEIGGLNCQKCHY